MAETVVIGCRLPNGIILEHPSNKKQRVTLAGINSTKIIGSTHGTTHVDAGFWQAWKAKNADFSPLKNGAIFEAHTASAANDKAKELAKEKTGFEPMQQSFEGLKSADRD